MSAELHYLSPVKPFSGLPEKHVVEVLQDLLAEAMRGEIKGIGIFYVSGNDGITTDWTPGCADRHFMAAGSAMLNHRILKAITE